MIYLMKINPPPKPPRNSANLTPFLSRIVGKEFGRPFIRLSFTEWEQREKAFKMIYRCHGN